jgi:NitT/TauT family transport system substrate-binding protein
MTGYVATGGWVKGNPRTLAAFSRAIQRATLTAADDTAKVMGLLPTYIRGWTPKPDRVSVSPGSRPR